MKPFHPSRFLPLILAAAACVLVALCLWQVVQLKEQLNSALLNQEGTLSSIDAAVQAFPAQVEDSLRTQDALLTSYDWNYGTPNPKTWTIPVTFTAVPKEQTVGVTNAALVCNGKSYPMDAQVTGDFTVTLEVPLLQSLNFQQVLLTEGQQQRVETLDLHEFAGAENLLHPWIMLDASHSIENNKLVYQNSTLHLTQLQPDQVASISAVATVDGKEVGRTPIPVDADPFPEGGDSYSYGLYPTLDASYPVPAFGTFVLSVEILDDYGLRYVTTVEQFDLTSNDPQFSLNGTSPMKVYTPQGTLIWEGTMEAFSTID